MVEPHLSAECGGVRRNERLLSGGAALDGTFPGGWASIQRRKGGEKLVLKQGPTMAADPTAMLMALQSPGESPL